MNEKLQEFDDYLAEHSVDLLPAPEELRDYSYEVDGMDVSWTKELLHNNQQINIAQVFTVVEGDSGDLLVLPGFHIVNRMYYLVTDKSYTGKTDAFWKL